MSHDDPDLEQRLARFEAQLDRFSLTLHQWQQSHERVQAVDPHDVDRRIRVLEETVEREARVLRRMHEEPLKQLQAQTASLGEICVAATNSVTGLDQAESRLAALQADLRLHLTDLSRNFQALVADLRVPGAPPAPVAGTAASWPLDRVVHVHDELRRGMTSEPQPPTEEQDAAGVVAPANRFRPWRYVAAAVAAVAVGTGAFLLERRVEARLNDAAARIRTAEQQAAETTQLANRQIASAREDADRQIADARKSAQRAETIGAILTAPDLMRFALTGGSALERLSAQVLLSRSRGVVLSASRLPVAPPQTNYQLWLWSNGQPVSAGVFVPDANGRATLVAEAPPKLSGPVVNVEVTVEPNGGRPVPSGRTLLARLQ